MTRKKMKQTYRSTFLGALALLVPLATAPACVGGINDQTSDDDDDSDDEDDEEELNCTELGRTYTGIGGATLSAGRPEVAPYSDRQRMKPFSALEGEYGRVLGNTGADVAGFAATFGKAPARWFEEPGASANTMYASFTLAYQGCLEMTATGAAYAAAPDQASAGTACGDFARRFWDRNAETEEIDACVEYAVEGTASVSDVRQRWAYACASVLTAAGFVSY